MRRKSIQEVGYSDKIPVVEVDFSAEETATAARVRFAIEAMFGHARLAVGDERTAYIHTPFRDYVYDVLKNGYWERGGHYPFDTPIETDAEVAVARSLEEFTREFPDAKHQQLVWRIEPEFRRLKAADGVAKFDIPPRPACVYLYLRFTVTPLGVHGGKRN